MPGEVHFRHPPGGVPAIDLRLSAGQERQQAGEEIPVQEGEDRRRADAYMSAGNGSLVGCELKGGLAAGRAFIDSLQLLYHVANIGDARSLAIHPATTTHSQLTAEEQLATGVNDGYVRLSIGIEHADDIIADLKQALDAAAKATPAAAE